MKSIWKYKELIPQVNEDCHVNLGEGNTPLLKSKRIGKLLGLENLYFKLENLNPSGSYKDRFAAMAIAYAKENGKKAILATSSGNTGAALAAYSAAAGLKCIICLVDGAPFGKVQQMGVYGAELLMIEDFGINDKCTVDVMDTLNELALKHDSSLEISAYKFSPIGMEGVQTIAFEIAEELQQVDRVFVPAGGGGLFLSIVRGFSKWKASRNAQVSPTLFCVQPQGNDTIASVLSGDRATPTALANSTTKISGLQVSSLLDVAAIVEEGKMSELQGTLVEDADVFECQQLLAQLEGIYCEPAGAVALAGLKEALRAGKVNSADHIVCIVTGNGFKDQQALSKIYTENDCLYVNQSMNTKEEIIKKIEKE